MATKVRALPTSKQEAFVESPLYVRFSVEEREEEELRKFFLGAGTLDLWCIECRRQSVFHIESQISYSDDKKKLPHRGLISIEANCGRGGVESYQGCHGSFMVVFAKDASEVIKIGQYPSAADLDLGALDEAFDNELDRQRRAELGKAIGLRAHGIGIGSFVYLRRIFEALIEEAHGSAVTAADSWDEAKYEGLRVAEKIGMLREYLPSRLVESAHLYGILSSGIHALSEEECLDSFDLVKAAIELILRERLEERRYSEVVKRVEKRAGEIRSNNREKKTESRTKESA